MKKAKILKYVLVLLLIFLPLLGCGDSSSTTTLPTTTLPTTTAPTTQLPNNNHGSNNLELIYFGKINSNSPKQAKRNSNTVNDNEQTIFVENNSDYDLSIQVKNENRFAFIDLVIYSEVLDTMVVFNEGNGEYKCSTTTEYKNNMWITDIIINTNQKLIQLSDECNDTTMLQIDEINFLDLKGDIQRPSLDNVSISKVTFEYSSNADVHFQGEWEVTLESTCTTGGEKIKRCPCGYTRYDSIPAMHNIDGEGYCKKCSTYAETEGLIFIYDNNKEGYIVDASNVTSNSLYVPKYHENKKVVSIMDISNHVKLLVTPVSEFNFVSHASIEEIKYLNGSTINMDYLDVKLTIPSDKLSVTIPIIERVNQESFNFYKGAKYIGSVDNPYHILVEVLDKTQSYYTIHEDTVGINRDAFYLCPNLQSITIPNSVKYIGSSAFGFCSNLSEITLSNTLEQIDSRAFTGCPITNVVLPDSLTSISSDSFDFYSIATIKDNVIYLGSANNPYFVCMGMIDAYATNFKLHDDTIIIASRAFMGQQVMESIDLGKSLKFIGVEAFYSNSNLKNVIIPETCEIIRRKAFEGCPLVGVIKLELITKIEGTAFATSGSDLKVIVGKKIESLHNQATYSNFYCLYNREEVPDEYKNFKNILYYSETFEIGCWHYDSDGTTPLPW